MTIKQIAEVANVDESTIRRWADKASGKMPDISGKMHKARETSVAADFSVSEVVAIVRAGGNRTLADLLAENARQMGTESRRSPAKGALSGPVLRELQKIYHSADLQDRLDSYFGWAHAPAHNPVNPMGRAIVPAIERESRELTETMRNLESKGLKAVAAVAGKMAGKIDARVTQERLNGALDFGGRS